MKNIVLLSATLLVCHLQFLYGQDLHKGDIIGIDGICFLYDKPDTNSAKIDTIADIYSLLIFEIVSNNSVNNFVKVKINSVICNRLKNNVVVEDGKLISQSEKYPYSEISEPYLEYWVNTKQINEHAVPSFNFCYDNKDVKVLNQIIKNCKWHKYYNEEDYKIYQSDHAAAFLALSIINYENDSIKQAIQNATNAINILPNKLCYIIRAISKYGLKDYRGAIIDCELASNFDPIQDSIINVYNTSYLTQINLTYGLMLRKINK